MGSSISNFRTPISAAQGPLHLFPVLDGLGEEKRHTHTHTHRWSEEREQSSKKKKNVSETFRPEFKSWFCHFQVVTLRMLPKDL